MAKRWTASEISFVINNYRSMANYEMAEVINRSVGSVKSYMLDHGIRRTKTELSALRSRISSRPNSSHFKKGHVPHNANYDGHERITKDGYVEVRVAVGDYQLKHKVEWEKVNGKVPAGYCLKCVDGNVENTSPGNWKLITRIENMIRNSKNEYPEEIIPSIVLVNQIKNKIKTIEDGKK